MTELPFPFAREAIWTVASRGGLPPLLLQDVNFEELYAQVQGGP